MFLRNGLILLAALLVVAISSQAEVARDKNGYDCSRFEFSYMRDVVMEPEGLVDNTDYKKRKEFKLMVRADCKECCKEAGYKFGILVGMTNRICKCTNSLSEKVFNAMQLPS